LAYRILLTPQALKMLKAIPDRRIRGKLSERIEGLAEEPQKQGKPLLGPLASYRSLQAVGQRYRILYRVEEDQVLVLVAALGMRKEGDKRDVYVLAKKLIRLHLLEPPKRGVQEGVEDIARKGV
jgi:mRNA interferase RelE/StbE